LAIRCQPHPSVHSNKIPLLDRPQRREHLVAAVTSG
jgi:hypothetical protein